MAQEANAKVLLTGRPELATFVGGPTGFEVCRDVDEDDVEACFARLWASSQADAAKRLARRQRGVASATAGELQGPLVEPEGGALPKPPPLSGAEREMRRLRLASLCQPRQPPAWISADTFAPVLSSSAVLRRKAPCSLPPIAPRRARLPSPPPCGEVDEARPEGEDETGRKKCDGEDEEGVGSDEDVSCDENDGGEDGGGNNVEPSDKIEGSEAEAPDEDDRSSEDDSDEEDDNDALKMKKPKSKKAPGRKKKTKKASKKAPPKKRGTTEAKPVEMKPVPIKTKASAKAIAALKLAPRKASAGQKRPRRATQMPTKEAVVMQRLM